MNDRSLIASIASNTSWAKTEDRAARTAPGTAAFLAKFEHEVDPEGKLPPAERAKRAENLRRAHFQRLALKSVKARRRKAARRELRAGSETGAETVAPEGSRVPTGAPAAAPQKQTSDAVGANQPAPLVN